MSSSENLITDPLAIKLPRTPVSASIGGSARNIAQIARPVLIVAGVLVLLVAANLVRYHGNPTGFVQFGAKFTHATHPPAGAVVDSPDGYDGQFFYLQSRDPLLLHNSTIAAMKAVGGSYRLQRVGYPLLAYLVAGGDQHLIPFAMLAVNVIVLLALAIGVAVYLRGRGLSPNWAIAVALAPGMLLPTVRDLSDPLASAAVLGGLLLWRSGRRWPAVLALAVAVLTREVTIVVVGAVALHALVVAFRTHSWRQTLSRTWPIVVPVVAFAAWQSYVMARYGGSIGSAAVHPLTNLTSEISEDLHLGVPLEATFDLVYVGLMIAAVVVALLSARRALTLLNLTACALTIEILLPTMGDVWADTRYTAPVFALLLLDGLERRDRRAVVIGAAAGAMSLLVPFAVPGSF